MTNVVMFIEKIKKEYKGHIFINGERELVSVDSNKDNLKANMEWELNSVFGIDKCNITWLNCKQEGMIK